MALVLPLGCKDNRFVVEDFGQHQKFCENTERCAVNWFLVARVVTFICFVLYLVCSITPVMNSLQGKFVSFSPRKVSNNRVALSRQFLSMVDFLQTFARSTSICYCGSSTSICYCGSLNGLLLLWVPQCPSATVGPSMSFSYCGSLLSLIHI